MRLSLMGAALFGPVAFAACSGGSVAPSQPTLSQPQAQLRPSLRSHLIIDPSKVAVDQSLFATHEQAAAALATFKSQWMKSFGSMRPQDTGCPQVVTAAKGRVTPDVGYCPPENGNSNDPNSLDSYFDWAGAGEDGYALIGPSGGKGDVAIHNGKPDGAVCNGSPDSIGDNIGAVNGQPSTVTDINVITEAISVESGPGGELEADTITVGWAYKDNKGGYWVQEDNATRGSWSVGISSYFASLGFTPAGQASPRYVGTSLAAPPKNQGYQKCFSAASGGSQFG